MLEFPLITENKRSIEDYMTEYNQNNPQLYADCQTWLLKHTEKKKIQY